MRPKKTIMMSIGLTRSLKKITSNLNQWNCVNLISIASYQKWVYLILDISRNVIILKKKLCLPPSGEPILTGPRTSQLLLFKSPNYWSLF